MGIRVDKEALLRQLKEEGEEERLELYFHKRLMNDTLPLSIGGGIGSPASVCSICARRISVRYKPVSAGRYAQRVQGTQYTPDLIYIYPVI